MNEIKITHELCAEDRARLDRLTEALEKNTHNCASCVQSAIKMTQAVTTATQEEPAEEPKNEPQEPVEMTAPATTPAEEAKPAEEPKNEPTVTLEQIKQKVVQLCAGYEGKKKPAVRAIINTYGAKVSDLEEQPDKWTEVWDALTKLEEQ